MQAKEFDGNEWLSGLVRTRGRSGMAACPAPPKGRGAGGHNSGAPGAARADTGRECYAAGPKKNSIAKKEPSLRGYSMDSTRLTFSTTLFLRN
jgi:hypothetical protein